MTSSLTSSDKRICTLYGLIAFGALVGTQVALVKHFLDDGTIGSFMTDSVVNPAATFLTLDALFVAAAGLTLMVVEARRLGLPRLWLYVVLTFAVAISVAFPLFLIERQLHLARNRQAI